MDTSEAISIEESNRRAYSLFADYFVGLARRRSHFQQQASLVRDLLVHATTGTRVLDAACGIGDVLAILAETTDWLVAGSDGTDAMVACALQNEALQGVPLSVCRWSCLDRLILRQGQFDVVILLGNSVSHLATVERIRDLLRCVRAGLRSGGQVLFDFRRWVRTPVSGELVEPNRSVATPRSLGEVEVNGRAYEVSDCCSYAVNRQLIDYSISSLDPNATDTPLTVRLSYCSFNTEDAAQLLSSVGFKQVRVIDRPDYPYLVGQGVAER